MFEKDSILNPMQNHNHEIREAGVSVCRWQLGGKNYALWETPRYRVEGANDSAPAPHVLTIDCEHGMLRTEIMLDSAHGRRPEPMLLQLAKDAQTAAGLCHQIKGSAIISRYVNALALDNTPESYLRDLERAKELAAMEIRAEGPVSRLTVSAWLKEQGGEPVASLTAEAIQDLLEEKIIEVWDADEQVPTFGYCAQSNR